MQGWEGIVARLDGPLHFRFIGQPLMASVLAIIDGVKDAKLGKPPYFWAVITGKAGGTKYTIVAKNKPDYLFGDLYTALADYMGHVLSMLKALKSISRLA